LTTYKFRMVNSNLIPREVRKFCPRPAPEAGLFTFGPFALPQLLGPQQQRCASAQVAIAARKSIAQFRGDAIGLVLGLGVERLAGDRRDLLGAGRARASQDRLRLGIELSGLSPLALGLGEHPIALAIGAVSDRDGGAAGDDALHGRCHGRECAHGHP
jgi:hypothetical protein